MKLFLQKLLNGYFNRHMMGVIGLLFVGYSTLVVGTIITINDRKDIRTEIRSLQGTLAEREIEFFNRSSEIGLTTATELGLVTTPIPYFAYRNTPDEKVALVR